MSLVVDKIKCIEESNEIGADDIYLIVFRGRTVAPFESNLASIGPGSAWSDFDTGETHHTDVTIAKTQADAVYAVMMVEKDMGKDISGVEVIGAWKAQTDLVWKSIMMGFVAAGQPTSSNSAKAAGFAGIKNALNGLASLYMSFPKGNDDVIDVKRVTITSLGQAQTIRFRSDAEDATYDVTFKHV
uniref:Uncharacterized protein n=1 Tax=Caldilinea aerophila TaxID=133453 RepID=A0A7C1JK61_9CHLR